MVGVAADTLVVARRPVGEQLREWRKKRQMSQLSLASHAEVSARHLSFVETGRSAPSRDMVLRLAQHLDVPLRDRNDLLLAAGFALAYGSGLIIGGRLGDIFGRRRLFVLGLSLFLVVDRDWNLVDANRGLDLFTRGAEAELLVPPINALRLALHPEGLASRIVNLAEWRAHLLNRLYRRINLIGDSALADLYDAVPSAGGEHRR